MAVKIVAISDTHSAHNKLVIPECDILIHAGDESFRGTANETMDFAEWFDKQPAKHLVWTPGNHSVGFELGWPSSLSWMKSVSSRTHVLINSGVELEGLKIWGSPITPMFHNWAYNVSRGPDIQQYWDQIPVDTDVLVTHGPPYGIMDAVHPGTRLEERVGCVNLGRTLARVKPKLHVFGHIHEGYGVEQHNGTTYVNAAVMSVKYQPTNKPIVVVL